MNYLDVAQFETYVSACANNSGVTVKWDEPQSTPRTDGRTMWLPAITSSSTEDWLRRMRYFVKHETSHVVHSDFVFLNSKKPTGLLALINNLIEDHRIDYRNDMEYVGDRVISNDFWQLYAEDIKKRTQGTDKELAEQQKVTLPLFVWESSNRTWIDNADYAHGVMYDLMDSDAQDKLTKLNAYSDRLVSVRETGSAQDVWDLAVDILQNVFNQKAEDHQEDAKAKGKGEGKGDEKESDGEASKPLYDDVDRIINVDKLLDSIGHEHKPSRTGIHMSVQDKLKHGTYQIPKASDYVVLRAPYAGKHPDVDNNTLTYFKKYDVEAYITSNAHAMSNKLRIKLQTRSRDRYEYGKKSGKLHNGSLHRVLHGDVPSAQRLFRQRVVSDTTDTAVCLLVDCSGSMSGRKFEMACAGAGAMSDALKPLNISHAVLGFTNTERKEDPMIWVFNDYGEKTPTSELVSRFNRASACLWENTDGDAIAYATHSLLQRKEHRKVLLVLSDGSPAGRRFAGDIDAYTKQAVETAEKAGIDVYGVGIMDNNVEHFYKKHIVVRHLEDLSKTILNIIDRSL